MTETIVICATIFSSVSVIAGTIFAGCNLPLYLEHIRRRDMHRLDMRHEDRLMIEATGKNLENHRQSEDYRKLTSGGM